MVLLALCGCDRDDGHAPVADVEVEMHDAVATILVVRWQQVQDADAAWLEFGLADEAWLASPPAPRSAGSHEELILGVPAASTIHIRIVNEADGERLESEQTWTATTGALPVAALEPSISSHDPGLADLAPWLLGSVELADGEHFEGPFWTWIVDRQGRVVWYHGTPDDRSTTFARVSRDGTHVVMDQGTLFTFDPEAVPRLQRLDLAHGREETLEVPGMAFAWDTTDDGAVLFDDTDAEGDARLGEQLPDGTRRTVFDCVPWMGDACVDPWCCTPNAIVWVPATDTVLYSMWSTDTVLEIDRDSGEVVRQFGTLEGSWAFDPPEAAFDLQHYPHYTADGTLLVSTHIPDEWYVQKVREFALDDEGEILVEVWSYGDADDPFADLHGEAIRMPGGNTLINYGTEGMLREVTPSGETAWEASWPGATMIGHITPVDDLYALTVR